MARIRDNIGILHKVCSVYAQSHADREDLHQDIVLQLWRSYPSFSGDSRFSTWMYRVALNTALTRVRKPAPMQFMEAGDLDLFPAPPADSDRPDKIAKMYSAIRALNAVDRAIVLLWLDDLTYREIGASLGLSEKNVGVKLSRIKTKLAETVERSQDGGQRPGRLQAVVEGPRSERAGTPGRQAVVAVPALQLWNAGVRAPEKCLV
ncbi:sigma-70 family RNA polymerase sigma factor [Wenzhouxiangella sediminis]|uniref:Sigma-70 family RNA polymerase sigma factor n=1 Tax=Wenzhouxiangella sediminis TaxID=1792836 RepID=A0A3E1KA18_9GAMM|nr:sigma-70 family RNA polymerase sigma factor [Wenzhouxiangella sediminis]